MKVFLGTGALSLGEVAARCGGALTDKEKAGIPIEAVCTDSHEADPKTIFWTFPGKNDDGEAHVADAFLRGCPCAVCSQNFVNSGAVIQTEDRVRSLLQFAKTIRNAVDPYCVAITGSVGKTTTKEFVYSVISRAKPAFKTEKNHNSLIGLPLSLLELKPKTEWAVLEMGMNAKGEIKALSDLARPQIAAITNIGSAHIGLLGSQYHILQAKLEILSGLSSNGHFLLNLDDPFLVPAIGKSFRTISLSANGRKADFSAKNIRVEPQKTIFDLTWRGGVETNLELHQSGKQFVLAALFAFATGIYAGIPVDDIRRGLAEADPGELRQSISVCQGVTLIEDCYNASPESMLAALETLDRFCAGQKRRGIAVLGDMLELGKESERLHRKIGERIAKGNVKLLFTIGNESKQIALGAIANGFSSNQIFQNPNPKDLSALLTALQEQVKPGDVVLIKASRAIAAERVGSALKNFLEKRGQEPCGN